MPIRTADELKAYFQSGDKPTQAQFVDLIDTLLQGGGAVDVSFSASIPFDRDYVKMSHRVSGAIAFTPNATGKIVGGGAYVRLVADGVHTPTFDSQFYILSDDSEWGTANMAHQLVFYWNEDDYVLTIEKIRLDVGPDLTAPLPVSFSIENAAPSNVVMITDELLANGFVPSAGDFTSLLGKTFTPAIGSGVLTLTANTPYVDTDVEEITYTPGTTKLQDAAGNLMIAFDSDDFGGIINNILPVGLAFMTDGAHGGTPTESPAHTFNLVAVLDYIKFAHAAVGDCQLQMEIAATTDGTWISLDQKNVADNNTVSQDFGLLHFAGHYYTWEGSGFGIVSTGIVPANGDLMRLIRTVSTGKVKPQYSTNGGTTWIDLLGGSGEYTGTNTGTLYGKTSNFSSGGICKNPKGLGFA